MYAKLQGKVENSTKAWKSSSEETAESILSMIQAHNWQEGHKLPPQRALAESLGVSRPTVREALVILETMGKVNIQPGKGVFHGGCPDCLSSEQIGLERGEAGGT